MAAGWASLFAPVSDVAPSAYGPLPELWLVAAVGAALFGACVGSFLNVCIYRIPLDQSVVRPRSHCMTCGKLIPWYHNLPVLSYFVLRGRCASCGARFSFRYAAVELLTAFLFLAVACAFPPAGAAAPLGIVPHALPPGPDGAPVFRALAVAPLYWLFLSGLVIGTFIDFDHYFLPDSVTIGGMVAGLAFSALVPELQARVAVVPTAFGKAVVPVFATTWREGLLQSALGLAAGFLPLQTIRVTGTWLYRRIGRIGPEDEAMGFGDVKLLGAIGAFLGWQAAAFSLVAAALVGTLVSVPLALARRRSLLSRIPFGPYLALGALLFVFWGQRLVISYLTLTWPWRVVL